MADTQASIPNSTIALKGLRTLVYVVDDMAKAKNWYSALLGHAPYFDMSFYVGFNIHGYELGLIPVESVKNLGHKVLAYWAVEDIDIAYAQLLNLGCSTHSIITDVGEGIRVGTVLDPMGNVFGLIFNPNDKI